MGGPTSLPCAQLPVVLVNVRAQKGVPGRWEKSSRASVPRGGYKAWLDLSPVSHAALCHLPGQILLFSDRENPGVPDCSSRMAPAVTRPQALGPRPGSLLQRLPLGVLCLDRRIPSSQSQGTQGLLRGGPNTTRLRLFFTAGHWVLFEYTS